MVTTEAVSCVNALEGSIVKDDKIQITLQKINEHSSNYALKEYGVLGKVSKLRNLRSSKRPAMLDT